MADMSPQEGQPIDFRIYLGLILFRWQVITVCFLYSLLIGVLFLQLTPKKYVTSIQVQAFVDPNLKTGTAAPWADIDRHRGLLANNTARNEAIEKLAETWGGKLGDKRKLYLNIEIKSISRQTIRLSARTEYPRYAEALLSEIVKIHARMWESARSTGSESASAVISKELAAIEDRIRRAENDVFEFERMNDIRRVSIKAEDEDSYLSSLISQRRGIRTELWMMDVQFPALRNADVGVIESVNAYRLSDKGKLQLRVRGDSAGSAEALASSPETWADDNPDAGPEVPNPLDTAKPVAMGSKAEIGLGWQPLRYQLILLEAQERDMAQKLKEDHPHLKQVRQEIAALQEKLRMSAELEFRNMMDQYRSLQIMHDSLEAAEYKWQAVNWQKAQKMAELARLQAQVTRYEETYQTLYSRLSDMRITEEMNAERVNAGKASSTDRPVWPDPTQVLLIALAIGLGAGCGLALLAQAFDNKVQSIGDVERSLGVPFLGGVPFWVHSGLERAIRPIVTEEHSVGAVEAYRALRTSIVAAMAKAGEKVLIVTSADSREGKTLTSLNTAIMMAQLNRKVLLVDMDLRRGRLHRSLGVEKEPGMTNVLRGENTFRSVIVPTRVDNLYLAPPGPQVEDAPELLQSLNLQDLFVGVQDEFDYIICDTSPVLRVTDTVIFASQGFGVVMYVARVNHTPKPLIRYSLDMLKDARIIGMVLNSIDMHKISSLYYAYQYPNYAYYSNAYSYGYSYAYYGDGYGDKSDQEGKRFNRKDGVLRESRRSLKQWFSDTFLPTA